MLALVLMIKEDQERNRRMYRLLAVNGMAGVGLGSEQIATELGISARHVRRLGDRSPFLVVRKALFKETTRTEAEARKRARRIVAELRATLRAGGFQPYLDAGRDGARWPAAKEDERRPVFTERKLSSTEQTHLRAAGLSQAQNDAIATVGLGTDELQELLLLGINHVWQRDE